MDCVKVKEKDRANFLFKHLGLWAVRYENIVYSWMDKLCKEYCGGYWEFYEIHDGFFMSPSESSKYNIEIEDNYFDETLDSETTGIIVSLFALNFSQCKFFERTDVFYEKYYSLLYFSSEHKNFVSIRNAID